MKKIKKLNIIESGRLCSPEEMKEITGGYGCSSVISCDSNNKFVSCATDGIVSVFTSCGVIGTGFGSNCSNPASYSMSCGQDVTYEYCKDEYSICGQGMTYK